MVDGTVDTTKQQHDTAAVDAKETLDVVADPKAQDAAGKETDAKDGGQKASDTGKSKSLLVDDGDEGGDKDKGGEGPPEKYEAFTLPEGVTIDEQAHAVYSETFKDLGLSQAQAQKLVDTHTKLQAAQAEAYNKAVDETHAGWVAKAKADPACDKLTAQCRAALKEYGDAEVMEILGGPWGDHPAIRRFLAKAGSPLVEGGFAKGSASGEPTEKDRLKARYPKMNIE